MSYVVCHMPILAHATAQARARWLRPYLNPPGPTTGFSERGDCRAMDTSAAAFTPGQGPCEYSSQGYRQLADCHTDRLNCLQSARPLGPGRCPKGRPTAQLTTTRPCIACVQHPGHRATRETELESRADRPPSSYVMCYMTHRIRHAPYVSCHMSYATCHVPFAICQRHMPYATYHT